MELQLGKYTITSGGHYNLIANEIIKTKPKNGGEPYERLHGRLFQSIGAPLHMGSG